MKDQPINITPAEWEIMEVLWQQSPQSAAEIYEALQTQTDWTIKTVRSFLDRLVQKKAVRKQKIHGMNVFKPMPKRSQSLRQESESFLQRFFRGIPFLWCATLLNRKRFQIKTLPVSRNYWTRKRSDHV